MKQTISNTVKGIKIDVLSSEVVESPFHKSTSSRIYYCHKYYLKLSYKGNEYIFTFHDSVDAWEKYTFHGSANSNLPLNKKDVMYCLLSDMGCYESSRDMKDFLYSFGYDNGNDLKLYKQGMKAFEGCKKTSEKLHELFNNDELEQLQNEYMDY